MALSIGKPGLQLAFGAGTLVTNIIGPLNLQNEQNSSQHNYTLS
jgi:hypothetical protein